MQVENLVVEVMEAAKRTLALPMAVLLNKATHPRRLPRQSLPQPLLQRLRKRQRQSRSPK